MLVDSHCHCHEFKDEELAEFRGIGLVAVSDDLQSSKRTLALKAIGVYPCLGIHPWQVGKAKPEELAEVLRMIEKEEVPCIGEVGLDKRFVPETYEKQREFFSAFLRLAKEYGLVLNVHAPDAWRDVVEALRKADVDRALIHWYTGPLDLLEEIGALGYYVSVNPAVKIQQKHRAVAEAVRRDLVVTESDGPYEYRGMRLTPAMIGETIGLLAEVWKEPRDVVEERLYTNAARLFRL
ncbi:MAG: TatD family hydrolase [Thermoproteus sp. AZ2]|uniref:TatD family hydrolase n=1 Tax=Thermoproteus sp. AZ2 TaxID=1609232 RepID=A0ACC6V2F0_9CREN